MYELPGWNRLRRGAQGADRRIIRRYLGRGGTKRLQIGCGRNPRDGWLNADATPSSADVLRLDATRPYPFPDASFDYIFSEHVLEHLTYADGQKMLTECARVLEPGGAIRISTPDLAFLVKLYAEEKTDVQRRYITWAAERFTPGAPAPIDTFVINNYVRAWGHLFIYDEKVLRGALERCGFEVRRRFDVGESDDPELRGLENADRMPEGFLSMESVIIEAVRRA